MSTHRLQRQLDQMREAGYSEIADPGSGGTVVVSPYFGAGTLVMESTGARTLQDAANVPVGTRVLCMAQASSVTVNSVPIDDGSFVEFVRSIDSSDAAEWQVLPQAASVTSSINAQTGTTYTLALSDHGKTVTLSNASAITLTIPTALTAGFSCRIVQIGAGLVTIAGSGGMTVNTRSASLTMHGQHSSARVNVYATNACNVEGDISPLKEVNVQTGTSYTVLLSDNGGIITCNNASAIAVDFPDSLPVGFHCEIVQLGAGLVTVGAAGSATILTESAALTTNAQHGAGRMVCYASDAYNWATYDISGT